MFVSILGSGCVNRSFCLSFVANAGSGWNKEEMENAANIAEQCEVTATF